MIPLTDQRGARAQFAPGPWPHAQWTREEEEEEEQPAIYLMSAKLKFPADAIRPSLNYGPQRSHCTAFCENIGVLSTTNCKTIRKYTVV